MIIENVVRPGISHHSLEQPFTPLRMIPWHFHLLPLHLVSMACLDQKMYCPSIYSIRFKCKGSENMFCPNTMLNLSFLVSCRAKGSSSLTSCGRSQMLTCQKTNCAWTLWVQDSKKWNKQEMVYFKWYRK